MPQALQSRPLSTPGRLSRWLFLCAGLAFSGAGAASAAEFMTQEELLSLIPGSTIRARDNQGVPWVQAYSARAGGKKRGLIKGIYDKTRYDAKWFVEGDQWCEDWGSGQACFQVERVGPKAILVYEKGAPRKNVWKLD